MVAHCTSVKSVILEFHKCMFDSRPGRRCIKPSTSFSYPVASVTKQYKLGADQHSTRSFGPMSVNLQLQLVTG